MLRTLQLILPAIIPSWNFFDVIAPSPRIEYQLMAGPDDTRRHWQPFRPRPTHLAPHQFLTRLIWNPHWNESLFLVSCAERLSQGITPKHSLAEILTRIRKDLLQPGIAEAYSHFRFRLVFLERVGEIIEQETLFVSEPEPLA